ncbi:MAG: flagellar basal body rod protein FlgB [Deltaproteobacteria bacterium]|nr:flagellar basal body rod protein FlgB [Deltaproteobacteria bacterium]MBW2141355.1 flagellar basal body rod protein FlgB [Deltaproteobacteria bacterium]
MDVLGKIFGSTVDIMGKALNLRLNKHSFIASNLANMDTPGYKVKDLEFQKVLQQRLPDPSSKLSLRRTHPQHMPAQNVEKAYAAAQKNVVTGVYGKDEAGNDVLDIDLEMSKLAKNHLMYNATVQMLAKAFAGIKYAISEGGR